MPIALAEVVDRPPGQMAAGARRRSSVAGILAAEKGQLVPMGQAAQCRLLPLSLPCP